MYTETSLKPWVALPGELNLSHLILKFIIVIFYILYIFLIFLNLFSLSPLKCSYYTGQGTTLVPFEIYVICLMI